MENTQWKSFTQDVSPGKRLAITNEGTKMSTSDDMTTYNTFSLFNANFTEGESINLSFNEVQTQFSGESIVKHDNNFTQAMFNFIKSFVGVGVITIASLVKRAGIGNAAVALLFTASLSIVGTNLTINARERLLKDDYANGEFVGRKSLDSVDMARPFESLAHSEEEMEMDEPGNPSARSLPNTDSFPLTPVQLLQYNNYLKSYASMGQRWYGDFGYYFCTLLLASSQLIVLTAYMRFFDEYFKAYAMLGILLPTWMFMDLKSISFFSTIAIVLIVHSLFIMLGVSISDIPDNKFDDITYLEFFEFPLFFGAAIYMFEGDMVWMNIQDSMKKPQQFKVLAFTCLAFITFMWFAVWFIPYFAYGDHISSPIINSISHEGVRDYLKVAYTIAIGFGWPLIVYPLWEIWYRSVIADSYVSLFKNHPMSKFYICAVCSLLFGYFFSKVIPGIESFINCSGGVLGPLSTIIMPVAFYYKAFGKEIPLYELIFYITIWIIAGVMGFISFVATIIDEIDTH